MKFVEKGDRLLLKICQKAYSKMSSQDSFLTIKNDVGVNEFIYRSLLGNMPFMCGRLGTEFFATAYPYSMKQSSLRRRIEYVLGYLRVYDKDVAYAQRLVDVFCCNCGFFPNNPSLLNRYSELTLSDLAEVDLLGVFFGRERLLSGYVRKAEKCRLDHLEPYDYDIPWSKALAGKKVLVIHPFSQSIQNQYARREKIWGNPDVLPAFDLITIKAIQSIAGEKTPFDTWFDALEYMKKQMDETDYDITIIGCGAYGFHLAAHAKRMGKKAIHLGGATQILFGIKGKRWDNLPEVAKFYNDNWVYPSAEETPKFNSKVENGCYW